ncbi:orotidine-5'-phosphate decarboxylase [Lactiplantibacillus mudanjiangensis]|uniref:Orotidine 5'-phosphate decarboxylase n=1 Tax=Lactiplantibacillus mudanjiangensis TaxID=1296538 RepID=A0A660DWA0_9LACO|nr:orotidine-5'-phosphate decarboxylase [Lactiplantibacillus mudanjiangensis]VDG18886.1 orotidine-5'-phosphate decarboxylase [Lactobacillus pentosus] [Lactiplantibacillus mudanjiangensis]VDG25335.1 orotidine-5'-phosphate decarboxylase [Lactobacillus pentosus] [Lactiplantibacillus mudanjiangensis]VDG27636.1 orotidine-5'-phosphate decarboxylase [Lactobacillus pentosus] [Lactiplantibacillus mudanjiangensis]VDG32984.1 orotidine-5'-phosphate decarboxylase [Lactobacillus pentosus] [Lactiplantibacillu
MKRPLFIALDFPTAATALAFLDQFPANQTLAVKIGMELFYAAGPTIIEAVQKRGHTVFLDLKLHDIPHTVESAMRVLGRLGVRYTTVHAAGGHVMLAAAKAGLVAGAKEAGLPAPKLLAITQLTSTDQATLNVDQQIPGTVRDSVVHLAQVAQASGCDGVICSAQEVAAIHQAVGPDFLGITPGIRPAQATADDQQRVMTPTAAAQAGSNGLVIGRPITQATDPVHAYQQLLTEWSNVNHD